MTQAVRRIEPLLGPVAHGCRAPQKRHFTTEARRHPTGENLCPLPKEVAALPAVDISRQLPIRRTPVGVGGCDPSLQLTAEAASHPATRDAIG